MLLGESGLNLALGTSFMTEALPLSNPDLI